MRWKQFGCVWTTVVLAVAIWGCGDRSSPPFSTKATLSEASSESKNAGETPAQNQIVGLIGSDSAKLAAPTGSTEIDAAATTPKGHPKEWWEAVYANGTKIGWMHTMMTDVVVDGQRGLQIENQNQLVVDREGQRTAISISTRSFETPAGEPVSFNTEMNSGSSRTVMIGHVADGKLSVETTTQGKTTTETFPWTPGTLGFSATEQSLAAAPLLPGQRRSLRALMPATNQVVTIELAAGKFEPTQLLDHAEDLLRIDSAITLPMRSPDDKPPVLHSQLWINREGQVLKTSLAALHQETFRTPKEVALAESGPRKLDLVLDNTVAVARALVDPHSTRRVKYRVQLVNDDPAKVFASGRLQQVLALDPHTAEITVRSDSAREPAGSPQPAVLPGSDQTKPPRPPSPEDREPNNLIQSDDAQVIALAKSVAPDETDISKLAVQLESLVKHTIKLKNFSQAFATAAEVAREREGDCTEHSVLLAALARARGIPARVAIGLVYQPASQGFVYHMWNELWIDDRWVPMDATLGRGGIGAAHLKLTDSNLAGAQAYSSFLPVAQVIGQLKIEILEVE